MRQPLTYRVSIRDKDGKYAVFVETRGELSGQGMPMGELDNLEQASTVANFLQQAFYDCELRGLNDAYDRAIAIASKPAA